MRVGAFGNLVAQAPRGLGLGRGDLRRRGEAFFDAGPESDVVRLNEREQRRLQLEALDDAKSVAPIVERLAYHVPVLGNRQRRPKSRKDVP